MALILDIFIIFNNTVVEIILLKVIWNDLVRFEQLMKLNSILQYGVD